MKNNKTLLVIYVLTFIFVTVGSTFAFFSQANGSNEGALASMSTRVGINLYVDPLFTGKELIPMDDANVDIALENSCVDIHEFGACQAYIITVENVGEELSYDGIINFDITGITHLKYLLYDEIGETYTPITAVETGTDQSLGDAFVLPKDGTRVFKLVIWLSNIDDYQDEYDGGGRFNATVTYRSLTGVEITGSIMGG